MILLGNCLDILPTLPDNSVQCCVTSPPYWGLRDYGTAAWEGGDAECDHKVGRFTTPVSDKQHSNNGSGDVQARDVCPKCGAIRIDAQLGLEPTPEAYVANLVAVFREVRRVLREDGVCWLNLGDSYAGSNCGSNDHRDNGISISANNAKYQGQKPGLPNGLKPKDLVGIPWRVAFALQADGWWLRQDIIWHKPNPMPESVTDRCTKAHEYVFLLSKSARYYYDNEAVKEPSAMVPQSRNTNGRGDKDIGYAAHRKCPGMTSPTARNRRDVWSITTQGYSEAHFATMPEKLVEPCVLAGTSEKGCCSKCGAPWRRVVERQPLIRNDTRTHSIVGQRMGKSPAPEPVAGKPTSPITTTIGWRPTCDCGADVLPCVVLDPFSGAGTVGVVAARLGREYIGIELNPNYVEMSERRIAQVQPLLVTV